MKPIDEIKQEIEAFNKENGFDISVQVYSPGMRTPLYNIGRINNGTFDAVKNGMTTRELWLYFQGMRAMYQHSAVFGMQLVKKPHPVIRETVILPAHFTPWLINADVSGYSNEELKEVMEIERKYGSFISVSDDTWFGRYQGIGQDLATFAYIPR